MKKKVTVISACLVLFVAWLFGVIYTNVRAERPVVKTYYMNENVPYEDDYFRRADNILNGYSATVLGYEIIPYDEYAEKYNIDLPEIETDEAGNTLFPWKLHTMKNGLRVGIVGIVTDYVNIWEKEENLKGIHITDPFEAAKNALAQMKEQTDLTICIYHGGFECDLESGETLSQTTENVGYRICKELDFDIY